MTRGITSASVIAMATELQYHHTKPGGDCTCGHSSRVGDWISLHRANWAETAIYLYQAGVPTSDLHEAVITTRKLIERD